MDDDFTEIVDNNVINIIEEDMNNKDYIDQLLETILDRRRRRRVKRDADAATSDEDDLPNLLSKTIRERQSSTSQTVGSMLAKIPGILEKHGVSFESIGNNIIEASFAKTSNECI